VADRYSRLRFGGRSRSSVGRIQAGLRDLGYVEGQNIVLESRWANGRAGELPRLAEELVRLRVDLLAIASTPAALAMKHATTTIPVVFMSVGEVAQLGLVPSVARPGGNITGVATLTLEVSQKWAELLKDAVPITRLGIIWDEGNAAAVVYAAEVQKAARSLAIEFRAEGVRSNDGLERVLSSMKRDHVNALVLVPGPMFFSARNAIAALVGKYRLPAVTGQKEYAEAGMLMAYGANLADR
jgi:putative ABC transport system substrate-binding protein